MKKESITAVGIMSGTSLDGLDLCYVTFHFNGKWQFKIQAADCIPYDGSWRKELQNAHTYAPGALAELSRRFGEYTAEKVNSFLQEFKLEKPALVCSHGHTVFHDPARKYTLQIGDGKTIAQATGITCVSDFRSLDVSLGGQGAPLVPIGDELLFAEYDACLNLGGFSNISFKEKNERRAFDVCPVNIVLNPLANFLGKPFDHNGSIARSGKLDAQLLNQLDSLPIYKGVEHPSLAREWLEKEFLPIMERSTGSLEDKLHTMGEHAARQISHVINAKAASGNVLITGGGVKNGFLVERISALSKANIVIPDMQIMDYKEALIFAFLGVLRMRNEINVLKSVTNAERDSCSGEVAHP